MIWLSSLVLLLVAIVLLVVIIHCYAYYVNKIQIELLEKYIKENGLCRSKKANLIKLKAKI